VPPSHRLDRAQMIFFFTPFFPAFSPFLFPFLQPQEPPGQGQVGGWPCPPCCSQPPPWGDPWLCRGGPSPCQRWADRAIQPLVTLPVTNRPRLTRTDGGASRPDAGGESGAGSGPGGCGRGAGGGIGQDGEVGLRWQSWGRPAPGPTFGVWAGANLISLTAASSQSLA